jgi:thioredoxin-like negative regulator of GroEL
MRLEYFTAPWCAPCKTFGPIMDKVAKDYELDVEKIDIQATPERIPADVLTIPTVILYLQNAPVARFSGPKQEQDLITWIATEGANA